MSTDYDYAPALKKLGYVVRFYRRQLGYTQIQMASALDISSRNFQRFEIGQVEPKLSTLFRISRLVGVPTSHLIRPTTEKSLFRLLSSKNELDGYTELDRSGNRDATDLKFTQTLVEKDRADDAIVSQEFGAFLEGNIAHLSPGMQKFTGISTEKCDIQPIVVLGSAVERWELAFRLNLRTIMIDNALLVPNGLKFVREHHVNLNPDPENPKSEVYFRDVTDRHHLEDWIKMTYQT